MIGVFYSRKPVGMINHFKKKMSRKMVLPKSCEGTVKNRDFREHQNTFSFFDGTNKKITQKRKENNTN